MDVRSARTISGTSQYVSFNHYSAKEYLRQNGRQLLPECDQGPSYYLAQSCLYYLAAEDLNEVFVGLSWRIRRLIQIKRRAGIPYTATVDDYSKSKGGCAMLSKRFPFLNYSSRNWYKHIETRQHAELLINKIYPLLDRKTLYLPSTGWGHWKTLCLLHYPLDRESCTLREPYSPEGHNPGLCSLISLIFTRQPDWSIYSKNQLIDALVPRSPAILTMSSQDHHNTPHRITDSIQGLQEAAAGDLILIDPVLGDVGQK